jgi:hypothetical protein
MHVSAHRPSLVVTSSNTFWKSKEAVESNQALGEFFDLHQQYGNKVEVGAALFQEGFASKLKRRGKSLLKPLAAVAAGAGLLAAAAVTGGLVTIPVALALVGGTSGAVSAAWMGADLSEVFNKTETGLPQGLSVQHSGSKIDFSQLQDDSKPSDGLRELTIANMKRYPSSLHVVHMNGHGQGAKAVAGIAGDEAKKALDGAVKATQKKIDVAFYETCLGANFEFLHGQADVAEYAVAFEDLIPKSNTVVGRLPLKEILSQAIDAPDAKTAAVKMAERAGAHFEQDKPAEISGVPLADRYKPAHRAAMWRNTDSTAVAVDLGLLRHELSPSLDVVGRELSQQLKTDKPFQGIVDQARQDNALEGTRDLIDLGGFLSEVKQGTPESNKALHEAVDKSLEALNHSLLHKRTGDNIPLSGLSFHSKPNTIQFSNPGSKAHADPTLPQGWVEFVDRAFS